GQTGGRAALARASAAGASPLLPVPLDRVGVARLGLVGLCTRVPECPPLAQQIPAHIELDLDAAQARRVRLEPLGRVALLAAAQLVLLGNEALDPRRDAL